MKTCKFYYSVFSGSLVGHNFVYDNKDKPVAVFPTLAMARNFCTFNRSHFRIVCSGYLEYNEGVEIK